VFGSEALQLPPPPVQALAGTVATVVCELVLTAVLAAHPEPSVAAPQVYVSCPEAILGPPTGVKSPDAFTVIDPLPPGVVRARKLTVKLPAYDWNVVPAALSVRLDGTDNFPIALTCAESVSVTIALAA